MSKYFNFFDGIFYDNVGNNTNYDLITNITTKFSFDQSFKKNSIVFYQHSITDGETPEMLAHKIYGSAERHWIILSFNDIVDPRLEWPIEQRSLIDLIDKTYQNRANTANNQTGLSWAKTNIHSYYVQETQINETNTKTITENRIDSNTYANTSIATQIITTPSGSTITVETRKYSKTYYEYEIEQNDEKRIIKILKPEFAPLVEQEFRQVFN
jgi:hypothetical protein